MLHFLLLSIPFHFSLIVYPTLLFVQTVFRTCLSEIDRCKRDNINPFFINLLSERYGWVPVGEQLPASVAEEYDWVPLVSITHMEILHGKWKAYFIYYIQWTMGACYPYIIGHKWKTVTLGCQLGAYRTANPNAAFFIRDSSFARNLPEEVGSILLYGSLFYFLDIILITCQQFVPQFVDKQPLSVMALTSLKVSIIL